MAEFSRAERAVLRAIRALGLKYKVIDTGGDPYLLRVYLLRVWRERLPGVFLHCFLRGDYDRELHNHPWDWALSVILSGGYAEERLVDGSRVSRRARLPLTLNLIRANDFHRVELFDRHCWSLFIAGPRRQHWGFWDRATGEFRRASESRA